MKILRIFSTAVALCGATFLNGCATGPMASPYHVTAYKPHNPNNVSVKVSTSTQHIYVKEGDRLLMAVQGTVGENNETPSGSFRIYNKLKTKRSGSFGFTSSGAPADIHKGQSVAVGYPMAYWCEFAPGYGFHQGFVWSIPRTHGCIRLHKEAAARLFQLVKIGTPVNISRTQPEDAQYGKLVRKLDQRNDPDPPTSLLMSDRYFTDPPGPLLIEE
jgi:lipoprotein-anchoring transpeptidase ErfK/SrfK